MGLFFDDILPSEQILTDDESLKTYGSDWTKHYTPKPQAIVFPKTTEQVRDIVLAARKEKVALVPSGGRTGLSAAAFATQGEVVVSFERMNKILDFNTIDQTALCQAGVITEQLQNFATEKGYLYPVDFAARGSSQIGGNIATNAGGIKVIRYGLTRNWIAGLKVVTGAGDILEFNKSLVKNASGYDLRHLFIGSEGTLGFVTEASVLFARAPKDLTTFVFGVNDLSAVMSIFEEYKSHFNIMAYEMFTDLAVQYVTAQGHVGRPFETQTPYYVLVELENESEQSLETAGEIFEKCMEKGWIVDGTMSQNDQQAKNLWRLREDITEATSHKFPYKNDVSVKISRVPEFLQGVDTTLKKEHPHFEVVWFGHIGDGNLHINILKPDDMDSATFVDSCRKVDEILFTMIEKFEGSVSAEHGVGLTKKPFLHHTRSKTEVEYMRQIKKVFDPDGILNPGKIFDS